MSYQENTVTTSENDKEKYFHIRFGYQVSKSDYEIYNENGVHIQGELKIKNNGAFITIPIIEDITYFIKINYTINMDKVTLVSEGSTNVRDRRVKQIIKFYRWGDKLEKEVKKEEEDTVYTSIQKQFNLPDFMKRFDLNNFNDDIEVSEEDEELSEEDEVEKSEEDQESNTKNVVLEKCVSDWEDNC